MSIAETDPQIAELILQEEQRQASTLELIASENHVSKAVMEAAAGLGKGALNEELLGFIPELPGLESRGAPALRDVAGPLGVGLAEARIGLTYLVKARSGRKLAAFTTEDTAAWESYCQILLCANEFIYME